MDILLHAATIIGYRLRHIKGRQQRKVRHRALHDLNEKVSCVFLCIFIFL